MTEQTFDARGEMCPLEVYETSTGGANPGLRFMYRDHCYSDRQAFDNTMVRRAARMVAFDERGGILPISEVARLRDYLTEWLASNPEARAVDFDNL